MSWAMVAVAAATVVSAAVSYNNGQQQLSAQKDAAKQAQANAMKQEQAADQANNAASQKKPNTSAIMDAASQSGKAGVSGTMLTGPMGVDPSILQLGKSTLLGS